MFAFKDDAWGRSDIADGGMVASATLADLTAGLICGTQVATQLGWRDVGAVVVGDQVLTFDGGMQTVVSVNRKTITSAGDFAPGEEWLMFVPEEALGNQDDMYLLPQQTVMVESDVAEEVFGDPFAMIAATALEGYSGITRVPPPAAIEIVTLTFAQDEVVFANTGALMYCPRSTDIFDAGLSSYDILCAKVSAALVGAMRDHERGVTTAPFAA